MHNPPRTVAELKAAMASALQDPKFLEGSAMIARIAARGPLSFAIAERPLSENVAAIVCLGQPGPTARYAVVCGDGFDDIVVQLALATALAYESTHEHESVPVSLAVRRDGSISALPESGIVFDHQLGPGNVADLGRQSKRMLAARHRGHAVEIKGVGLAMMVPFPEA